MSGTVRYRAKCKTKANDCSAKYGDNPAQANGRCHLEKHSCDSSNKEVEEKNLIVMVGGEKFVISTKLANFPEAQVQQISPKGEK
jgi:hypothetical protein